MKRARLTVSVLALGMGLALGCGSSSGSGPGAKGGADAAKDSKGNLLSAQAQQAFASGVEMLRTHDDANDWTDATCAATAKKFLDADDEQGGKFLEAKYNAGVAYQRCKNDAEAKKIFVGILEKDPKYHRARVQVALYNFKEGGEKDVEGAIGEMQRAVRDAEYKNIEALVQLAMLQMKRQNDMKDDDGDNDLERAKKNLQRALAINDGFMPAFNQLAIYYYSRAKEQAAAKAKGPRVRGRVASAVSKANRADSAALELAALVCSQAIRKNPNYGPVYNTSGLISAELGDLSQAAQSFGKARQLDPKFFEAHMNYGAVNLQFRGFAQAESAYRAALGLRPNDYEAHLGLALAVRGLISDTNFDKNLAEALKEIEAAKKIDPDRAETYYNQAILVQEFKARQGSGSNEKTLLEARSIYDQFVSKAGGKEEFADAVKRSKERMKDIDDIIAFNKQTAEEKKRLEEMQRQQAAQQQMKETGTGEAGEAPPEGGEKPQP
jgi:tetratricopeptide (TPR) repeat protein